MTDDSRTASNPRLPMVARILLGLIFLVMGLNGFLMFIPPPSGGLPKGAMDFGIALAATGYMTPLVSGTQVVTGALLLANRFVPLALVVLAPVIVNILAFHVFLDLAHIPLALVVGVLEVYLLWAYRGAYAPGLTARAQPGRR